jgi:hypothetical protein
MKQVNHLYFTQIPQTSTDTLYNPPLKKLQFSEYLLKPNFPSLKLSPP